MSAYDVVVQMPAGMRWATATEIAAWEKSKRHHADMVQVIVDDDGSTALGIRRTVPLNCCDPDDVRDCDERASCTLVGTSGHWSCGMCRTHRLPNHICGCRSFVDRRVASA